MEYAFKKVLGDSIFNSKIDEEWKRKRKAVSHAFYKDRLGHYGENLKTMIMESFREWESKIDASPDKSFVIDITVEFQKIFAKNILTIVLGDDLGSKKIDLNIPVDNSKKQFTKKSFSMVDAMRVIADQMKNNA